MVPFIPTPYPDELFYSICARYHIWGRNPHTKASIDDLFFPREIVPAMHLPTGLSFFYKNLLPNSALTPEYIIQNHSLFPFYQPFLPAERTEKVKEGMIGLNTALHRIVGNSMDSQKIKYLRYCKDCINEDVKVHGEPYWHRSHQEYGVKVCPHHNSWLYESEVKAIRNGVGRQGFIALDEEDLFNGGIVDITEDNKHLYCKISKDVYWLLNHNNSNIQLEEVKKRLRLHLKIAGFITDYEVIKQEFFVAFRDYYSNEFLEIYDSAVDVDNRKSWLAKMFLNIQSYFKPVRFILILNFLGINISDFFNNEVQFEPFGKGPWLCFNPVGNHFNKRVIGVVHHEYDKQTKTTIGKFTCSCGFSYSRTRNSDETSIEKILDLGSDWKNELTRLIDQEKQSYHQVSELYNVDPDIIEQHYKSLNVYKSSNLDQEKRDVYRLLWQQKRSEYPDLTRTEFYKKFKNIYGWLIKNDYVWLNNHLPPKKKYSRSQSSERVNWVERDQELAEIILKIANQIKSLDGKPKRVTKALISEYLKHPNQLETLEKLPQTTKTLDVVLETIDEFRSRKVIWATQLLKESNRKVSINNICKLVGKYKDFSDEVKQLLNEQLYTYS